MLIALAFLLGVEAQPNASPDKNLAGVEGVLAAASHKPSGDVLVPPAWNDYLRSRLKAAGIPFVVRYDEDHFPGKPMLLLLVADDFSRVDLELRQQVYLARKPSVSTSAVTWSCSSPAETQPVGEYCVDRFIREWREANPR